MKKRIPFKNYRYHLVPVKSDQLSIFNKEITVEQLKEKKNQFFSEILLANKSIRGINTAQLPIEIDYAENDIFIMKLAVERKTTLYKDFKPLDFNNQPFIYIAINNDSEVQKILIEDNQSAFKKTSTVRNILQHAYSTLLAKYELTIHIEPVVDQGSFWDFVGKNQKKIEKLEFEIVKPNLASISKSLTEPLKHLIDVTNSHKTNISLKAPENGVLENINKKNTHLNNLVNYSNEGGGDNIKMKLKGIKKKVSTSNMVKETYIDSAEFESTNQLKLIDVWNKIFE
ncbi:hypothetical protein [Pedobacter ghigonis]|uniref:hypothetical protein n=1 Tax=Pedobacter ghigonis TaxID=2730403 RepID=UPI00158F0FF8|nr:hypothetical protein [Pedobacter ghigonis]